MYIKYGKWYETISDVTGLIKQYEKDTWLRKLLEILGKDHSEEAITEMQKYYYKQFFTKINKRIINTTHERYLINNNGLHQKNTKHRGFWF